MNLFELTHARKCAGGGTRKYLTKTSRLEDDNVVLQCMKGGVLLNSIAKTRDGLC